MSGTNPIRRPVVVRNPHGLHMRPATAFATKAKQYACRVTVWNGPNKADGKSSLDLILLVALPGSELTLEVDGADACAAADALEAVLGSDGDGL